MTGYQEEIGSNSKKKISNKELVAIRNTIIVIFEMSQTKATRCNPTNT
jgi:hypothetical protein